MNNLLIILLLSLVCFNFGQRIGQHGVIYPTSTEQFDTTTPLTVHLVSHTHDDLGWLKSVDSYFYGTEANIIKAGVQYILDSVIMELTRDPTRQFIYVESGYFKRWWDEQDQPTQELTKKLVKDRQLIFIHGGYVMNDEAVVYYEDSIDQMTLGHKFLWDTFQVIPQIAWHIDPFGHASAQASMYAQMGFNAFYITRIDYQDKERRVQEKELEFLWTPETSLGDEGSIFTHVTYYHYGYPEGFCFDILCPQDPIIDNKGNCLYNVDRKSDEFTKWFRKMSLSYKSTHLMHTAGDDFAYQAAAINFKSMDKLLKYINAHPETYNMKISYSNPEDYITIINKEEHAYSHYDGDFFPYADFPNAFWTGYYTSKPGMKGIVRRMGEFLQASKNLLTLSIKEKKSGFVSKNWDQVNKALEELEEALALSQHHDAVTGTERNAVVRSYVNYLIDGKKSVIEKLVTPILQEKTKELGYESLSFHQCNLNMSATLQDCKVSFFEDKPVLVSIYNPSTLASSILRIKVPGSYEVYDHENNLVLSDLICSKNKLVGCTLYFNANLNANELSYYYLIPTNTPCELKREQIDSTQVQINQDQTLSITDHNKFKISQKDAYETEFHINYVYYESYEMYDNIFAQFGGDQNSGAYIFRPSKETISVPKLYSVFHKAYLYQGKVLTQIELDSHEVVSTIRVFNDLKSGIEIESFINSININDMIGKEIALVVKTPYISNEKTFYTDSMGLDMIKRTIRESTSDSPLQQPVAGNYYPIQSAIYIEDPKTQERMTIIPDRAQGGSSLREGQIELMVHRRVLADDARGVAEPLNEYDSDGEGLRQLVRHTLLFSKPGFTSLNHREVQYRRDLPPQVFLSPVKKANFDQDVQMFSDKESQLDMVKVISRPLDLQTLLIRVQNMKENETKTIEVKSLVDGYKSIVELSLSANQEKKSMIEKRLNWDGLTLNDPKFVNHDYLDNGVITLRPLEIRTFKKMDSEKYRGNLNLNLQGAVVTSDGALKNSDIGPSIMRILEESNLLVNNEGKNAFKRVTVSFKEYEYMITLDKTNIWVYLKPRSDDE